MLFAKLVTAAVLAVAAAGAATHAVVEPGPAVAAVMPAEESFEAPSVTVARIEP